MANDNSPLYHCAGKEAFFQVWFYEDFLHLSLGVATGTGRRGLQVNCLRRPMYPDMELHVKVTAGHILLYVPRAQLRGGSSTLRRGLLERSLSHIQGILQSPEQVQRFHLVPVLTVCYSSESRRQANGN